MRKVKINFHGFLKDLIPETITGSFETVHDALMFLSHNYPKLKAPLSVGRYCVTIDDYTSKESLYSPIYTDEINIRPYFSLSKSAGTGQIIVGAIMVAVVAAAVIMTGGAAALLSAAAWGSALGGFGGAIAVNGAIMMAMGILTLLTTPKIKNKGDHNAGESKYLGTPGNTTSSGTPIPIGYGRYKVSGHFLSLNVSSSSVVLGDPK